MDRHLRDDLISQYLIASQPYYRPTGREMELYQAAYAVRMPMMLKGPTGCGKTRFVEYMAWQLGKPLVTIACHEDMTASDLVDYWLFVIDAAGGTDIPRKKGLGVLKSDLLVINKADLAPYVRVDLQNMLREASQVRAERPVLVTNCHTGKGVDAVVDRIAAETLSG